MRERHEQGLLNSLDFLKAILEIAKDVVEAEKQNDPVEEKDRALAALTELFNEVKSMKHPCHRGTGRDGDRRHRAPSAFRRLAGHYSRRARGETSTAAGVDEVQAAHRSGTLRKGLRVRP